MNAPRPRWLGVPYSTGRVKIGSKYAPPERVQDMGREAERLQSALLERRRRFRLRDLLRWLLGDRP